MMLLMMIKKVKNRQELIVQLEGVVLPGSSVNLRLMATAAGNVINILDVEIDQIHLSLQGHTNEISSICWNRIAEYMASL